MAIGCCGKCAKAFLVFFNILLWLSGILLLFASIWMIVDPKRSYLLDLVNFSEQDPLLRFSVYICIAAGVLTIVIGFLGCCGALKDVQCMLVTYVIFLVVLLAAEVTAGALAIIFKDKLDNEMSDYFHDLVQNRYGRQKWVTELVDTVQYYQHCCGNDGPRDFDGGFWQLQSDGAARNVPPSCCTQNQDSRPPDRIRPVDPQCTTGYPYDSASFKKAVHQEGCHKKLLHWFDQHAFIFIVLGLGIGAFQLIGIVLSICLCRSISKGH